MPWNLSRKIDDHTWLRYSEAASRKALCHDVYSRLGLVKEEAEKALTELSTSKDDEVVVRAAKIVARIKRSSL
jgi:hypothetical protein